MPKDPFKEHALEPLKNLACTSILDALEHRGYDAVIMRGVRTLTPGCKLVGRAVTLRFPPVRPDLQREVRSRWDSAEYRAMELCGPGDVLVIDAMGLPFASVGGHIKFLRLKRRGAGRRAEWDGPRPDPSSRRRGSDARR